VYYQSTHFSMLLLIRTCITINLVTNLFKFDLGLLFHLLLTFQLEKVKVETNGSYVSETMVNL
jgi:hypothetical protein